MFYIPKSHTIPKDNNKTKKIEILTSDGDFLTVSGELYYGNYHYNENNVPYTGIIDSIDMQLLHEISSTEDEMYDSYYYTLHKQEFTKYVQPKLYIPKPSDTDYKKTTIKRYFLKRYKSDTPIIEIDEVQYKTLPNKFSGIDDNLYYGIELDWKIYGYRFDVKENNIITQYGVYDTNDRTLSIKELQMSDIRKALPNLVQFAKIIK